MIAAVLDLIFVIKYSHIKISAKDVFLRPLLAAVGMGIAALLSYEFLAKLLAGAGKSAKLATVAAILIAGVVYLLLLIITGAINSQDLEFIPKGEKIRKKLDKFKLLK